MKVEFGVWFFPSQSVPAFVRIWDWSDGSESCVSDYAAEGGESRRHTGHCMSRKRVLVLAVEFSQPSCMVLVELEEHGH